MIPQQKWFERTWAFALPVSQFPNVVERLRGTGARLEERTRGLPSALLVRRDGEAWSIQEQAGHLLDLEPLWLRRAEQLLAGEAALVAADLTNRKTREADHNARAPADILREFRAARGLLVRLLEGADEAAVVRSALHPRLGTPMRLIDLALFTAEHDDHHLAAITALRARWGAA
jgi:uncharacterized damage-inducible protein DinB